MQKINITQIDYGYLDREIEKFKCLNSGITPYMFVNNKTLRLFMDTLDQYIYESITDRCIMIYAGCNVYIDTELEDGIVLLRWGRYLWAITDI